jgi:hypothetical protein
MKKLNISDVTRYVKNNIDCFHQKRYDAIDKLKLNTILKKKNPYLFKVKSLQTAGGIVKGLTAQFIKDFCKENGEIDWIKLVEFNSGKK